MIHAGGNIGVIDSLYLWFQTNDTIINLVAGIWMEEKDIDIEEGPRTQTSCADCCTSG